MNGVTARSCHLDSSHGPGGARSSLRQQSKASRGLPASNAKSSSRFPRGARRQWPRMCADVRPGWRDADASAPPCGEMRDIAQLSATNRRGAIRAQLARRNGRRCRIARSGNPFFTRELLRREGNYGACGLTFDIHQRLEYFKVRLPCSTSGAGEGCASATKGRAQEHGNAGMLARWHTGTLAPGTWHLAHCDDAATGFLSAEPRVSPPTFETITANQRHYCANSTRRFS